MAFYKIEETDKHTVYRCHVCKALAVSLLGAPPPSKCGKCK